MSYPTYEDARARERELLKLAQRTKTTSPTRREDHSIFHGNDLLAAIRDRYSAILRTSERRAQRPSQARA